MSTVVEDQEIRGPGADLQSFFDRRHWLQPSIVIIILKSYALEIEVSLLHECILKRIDAF